VRARDLVRRVTPRIAADKGAAKCSCRSALEHALITAPEARDAKLAKRLSAVAGRVLKRRKP